MATKSIFELPEYKPYESRFMGRMMRFQRLRRYYDGTVYDDSAFKLAHRLYAETKALLSFLARAVDLDVALVPGLMGAWALEEGTPDAVVTAQKQLFTWSKWSVVGDEWMEDGATLGEAILKIVPGDKLVQLQRLKPELAMVVNHVDPQTQQPLEMAMIVDRSAIDNTGTAYEYAEIITPGEIRTYFDGAPHGYAGQPDRYENPLGFVPVVSVQNDSECRPTFAKALPSLNSVNELASYLANIIGRHAEPQWAITGAEQGDLSKAGDNIWYLPSGSAVDAVLAQIDVPGTLEFIREIKGETKSNLPELAFDDLRAKDQIATETLEIQLVELHAKVWKMRRRYDSALCQAQQMAALAAAVMGIGGIDDLLSPHELDAQRPVLPVSEMEMIRLEEARLALEMQKAAASGESLTLNLGRNLSSNSPSDNNVLSVGKDPSLALP